MSHRTSLRRPTHVAIAARTAHLHENHDGATTAQVAANLADAGSWELDDTDRHVNATQTTPSVGHWGIQDTHQHLKISGVIERPPLVLVVDDRLENMDLYRVFLTFAGFRVIEASNGEDAVARAEAERPDAIVMDLSMPVMDGYLATRLLKGSVCTRDIPIVVVTASGIDAQYGAMAAGCDAFLMKPCDPDVLKAELLARIRGRGDQRRAASCG